MPRHIEKPRKIPGPWGITQQSVFSKITTTRKVFQVFFMDHSHRGQHIPPFLISKYARFPLEELEAPGFQAIFRTHGREVTTTAYPRPGVRGLKDIFLLQRPMGRIGSNC